jgi:hypothetical protein
VNKIITRGFGAKRSMPGAAGPVTIGCGSSIIAIINSIIQWLPKPGQSGTKRRLAELDQVVVWAKLVEINDKAPHKEITGWINVLVKKQQNYASVMAEHVSTRIQTAWERIRVSVKRIK